MNELIYKTETGQTCGHQRQHIKQTYGHQREKGRG